nr:hypothetical protein [Tanacetum cinerariifolium]
MGMVQDSPSPPNCSSVIWYRLGDGSKASAWFDNWCSLGPLADLILNCDIYGVGLRQSAKVNEVIDSGSWRWPNEWFSKYPNLCTIAVPNFSGATDWLI